MNIKEYEARTVESGWLPDMDLNHDKQIQSLLCYRYTIGQRSGYKLGCSVAESRIVGGTVEALKRENGDMENMKRTHDAKRITLQRLNASTP